MIVSACVRGGANRALPRSDRGRRPSQPRVRCELALDGEGAALFREAVRAAMRTPEGVQHWYLKVIDSLAPTGKVGTVSIEGLGWGEVDFLTDIEAATKLTNGWI